MYLDMENSIEDYIVSKETNEIIGLINVCKDPNVPFLYSGKIIENKFPEDLILVLNEYVDAVNELTFSTLDEIESRINFYKLYLKSRDISIFLPHIDEDNLDISFYTKYPSSQGFLDSYP